VTLRCLGQDVSDDVRAVRDVCAAVATPQWDDACRAIDAGFGSVGREFLLSLRDRSVRSEDVYLALLAWLLLAVHPSTPLGEALQQHVSFQYHADKFRRAFGMSLERLLQPVCGADWRSRVRLQGFRFGRPARLAEQLERTAASPPGVEVRKILVAVADDLHVSLDPDVKAWLTP
jgi:hypothetical protein